MTRHTRVRQLHKFNKEKSNLVVNQPIKEAIDFYIGTEDIDPTFKWVRIKLRNGVHNMIFCRDSLDMWTVIVSKSKSK